jgi:hypothetical protein
MIQINVHSSACLVSLDFFVDHVYYLAVFAAAHMSLWVFLLERTSDTRSSIFTAIMIEGKLIRDVK